MPTLQELSPGKKVLKDLNSQTIEEISPCLHLLQVQKHPEDKFFGNFF
jgi:hypothetical protein